jgi:UPF0042 nucleotide-binding protein
MTAVPPTLDVTIITGMSGAGRSAAADVVEDLGYFVIDNLPPALIPKVAELGRGADGRERIALVVDVRSGEFVGDLLGALSELREMGAHTRVLFLDAADDVLVRRYEATRRKHPLAAGEGVSDGITEERALLGELRGLSDLVVDTSDLNVHELRVRLLDLFGDDSQRAGEMRTSIVSFGYKHGIPVDVDLLFDCRFLPNPHWVEELRPQSGTDPAVRDYVLAQPETAQFLTELERLFALLLPAYAREGKSYLSIGVGCTGGRHRSVVIATELAQVIGALGYPPRVHHRDMARGE